MGSIWAHKLPDYLTKHGVEFKLWPGWQTRSRSSGGFDNMMGVVIHHDASSITGTTAGSFGWSCVNSKDKPIGNGSLGRDGVFHLWAAGAANTAGKGGPVRSNRGLIGLDNGNRNTFNIEADNNGLGETWADVQIDAYVKLVAAVLDWATHETPGAPLSAADVWSHNEWAPTRKVDPSGPAKGLASGARQIWPMDKFRGLVLVRLIEMTPRAAPPAPTPRPVTPVTSVSESLTELPDSPLSQGDEVLKAFTQLNGRGEVYACFSNGTKVRINDPEVGNIYTLEAAKVGLAPWNDPKWATSNVALFRFYGPVVAPDVGGLDRYGVPVGAA